MSYPALHVLTPILGLSVNVTFQVIGFRIISSLGMLRSVIMAFLIGGMIVLFSDCFLFLMGEASTQEVFPIAISNLIIYGALGYCYFHFVNLGETARRIRILRELYDVSDGLSLGDILDRYNARDIVRLRINRLLDNGQLVYHDGRYYTGKPAMLLISKAIIATKLIILRKRSEFD